MSCKRNKQKREEKEAMVPRRCSGPKKPRSTEETGRMPQRENAPLPLNTPPCTRKTWTNPILGSQPKAPMEHNPNKNANKVRKCESDQGEDSIMAKPQMACHIGFDPWGASISATTRHPPLTSTEGTQSADQAPSQTLFMPGSSESIVRTASISGKRLVQPTPFPTTNKIHCRLPRAHATPH